jgi:hypothetical protein
MELSQQPIYIFDLDDTLALIDQRKHLVLGPWIEVPRNYRLQPGQRTEIREGAMYIRDPNFKPDWPAFYEACIADAPNLPVIKTLVQLWTIGADVLIWTGRAESVRMQTVMWLSRHSGIAASHIGRMLQMRPEGDLTPDHALKRKWYKTAPPVLRARLTAVFERHDPLVKMWRDEGVACFQVGPDNL